MLCVGRERAHQAQQARSLFIKTERTPNPSSLKFVPTDVGPGRADRVLPEEYVEATNERAVDFRSLQECAHSPLARSLFRVEGVRGVFLGMDFVTVSKPDDVSWSDLKPAVFATLMDFFASGEDVIRVSDNADDGDGEDDDEIVLLIKELLETRVRPAVQEDGGDIVFHSFDEETGLVGLKLVGSCAGCPSSQVTLKSGVENMLCHYIPEVKGVHEIGSLDEELDERVLAWSPTTSAN